VKDTLEGRVIGSYILSAYSDIYQDVSFDHYVRAAARVMIRAVANRCLDIPEAIPSVLTAIGSRQPLYAEDPLGGSLGERLRQNTPTGMIKVPLLIAQGLYGRSSPPASKTSSSSGAATPARASSTAPTRAQTISGSCLPVRGSWRTCCPGRRPAALVNPHEAGCERISG
jgi:hypothetical protein